MPVYKYIAKIKLGDGKTKKVERYKYDFRKVVDGITYRGRQQGFEFRDEAIEAERQAIKNLGKDTTTKTDILFKELFDLFYSHKKTKQKLSTLESYRYTYNSHLSILGNKPVSNIFPNTITKWKSDLLDKRLSEGATNRAIRLLRSTLQYGLKKGFKINSYSIDELDIVNLQELKKERIAWTKDDINKLFATFETDDIFYWYFKILLDSTMRPNEYRCLQVKDIQDNYLVVNKSVTTKITGKGTIIQPPKTTSSIRKVIMPKDDIDWLKEHTKDYDADDFIFGKDKIFTETTIKRHLDKHIELAGIEHGSLYNFRHTSITNMLLNGVPLIVVSKRAGHSSVSTTMNHYWHLFNGDDEKALNGLIFIENTLKNTQD